MSANDHMFDLKNFDRELQNGQTVQVRRHHHIGNIPVNEHFSGRQVQYLVGWYAAVSAADPEEFRALLLGEVFEKIRIDLLDPRRPETVALKQ